MNFIKNIFDFLKFNNSIKAHGKQRKNRIIVGIDASRSAGLTQKTGVEFVSDALIKNFLKLEKDFEKAEFVFYTPRRIDFVPLEKQRILRLKRCWTLCLLSLEMLFRKPDVLFVPVHTLPFFVPEKTFKIIHDIAFVKNPELYSRMQKIYLNFDLKRCLKKCTKIFVPAEAVKNDILKYMPNMNPDRVVVIPHGYYTGAKLDRNIIRKKQILYVGRIEEKKNVLKVINAFEKFNQQMPEYSLVLAGKPGHNFDKIKKKIEETVNVNWLGYVSEAKKQELMASSEMMCFLSKEEGFGIPVLEAFAFEVPIIASNIDVLKEVGGRSCLYVDPDNEDEVVQNFLKLASDEWLRDKLVQNGKRRSRQFDWASSARRYLEVINNG